VHPVSAQSTAERIAEQLRRLIVQGALAPGSQLGEVGLAGQLRVSRGPVREALARLVQEGLYASLREDPDAPELADVGEVKDAAVVEMEDDVGGAVRQWRPESWNGMAALGTRLVLGVAVDELAGQPKVEDQHQPF